MVKYGTPYIRVADSTETKTLTDLDVKKELTIEKVFKF